MKLVGFNFKKISVEKNNEPKEGLKINTNIDISDIGTMNNNLFKNKEELLAVQFTYSVNYDPEIAKITFEGNMLLSVEPKLAREVLSKWKDKTMPEEFRIVAFNIILRKSNIKALEFEDEMNLPLHIPLPKLSKKQDQEGQDK